MEELANDQGILGKKVGMTHYFTEAVNPFCNSSWNSNVVLQLKQSKTTVTKHIQLGFDDLRSFYQIAPT